MTYFNKQIIFNLVNQIDTLLELLSWILISNEPISYISMFFYLIFLFKNIFLITSENV